MKPNARALALGLILLTAVAAVPAADPGSSAGILALRNGQVLRGRIVRVGEQYLVSPGNGVEVRVPVEDVELQCRDLGEVYLHKRRQLRGNDAQQHLQLADWCLRHLLLSRALDELQAAEALDPRLSGVETRRRRLEQLRNPPPSATTDSRVVGAALERGDLDSLTRSLPANALADFTARIQPVLLNRCSNGGCHAQTGTNRYRLYRPTQRHNLPRRLTQLNLHATLEWVDASNPAGSALVVRARTTHGGSEGSPLSDRDQLLADELLRWVERVSAGSSTPQTAAAPAALDISQAALLRAGSPGTLPPNRLVSGTATAAGVGENAELAGSEAPKLGVGQPGDPQVAAATDPFSPDIFNRRYHAQRTGLGTELETAPPSGPAQLQPPAVFPPAEGALLGPQGRGGGQPPAATAPLQIPRLGPPQLLGTSG